MRLKFSTQGRLFWCVLLGVICRAAGGIALASEWGPIKVPGAWETNGPPAAARHDGFAWYRCWLKPSPSFFLQHERNLFSESVTLNIRGLAGAHEVFVNGRSIGQGGAFPPSFRSGREGNHRHKVPPGLLQKDAWNEIAIRVYNQAGPGGFLTEAPFIMDYFMECALEGEWEFQLGNDAVPSGPRQTRPPAAAFDQFRESSRVLGEAEHFVPGPKLPPAEAVAKFKAHPELAVELLLSEPTVAQPVHLSYDARGRLWVAQYRQYPYPAGLKMLSRDKYYRSHYDKIPPAPPHHARGRDVISIHEDSDGDGFYDRHRVFQDGLNMANAVLPGAGGVWVMHTPYLVFYPDANGDDVADGPPFVHLAGFGLEDTHSIANGLAWGMDGWIYGAQGSTTSSRVTRPGIDPPGAVGVHYEGCMVWRYHPGGRIYEVFAEGGGNVFGLEIDQEGRLYSGHNGGKTRGWHYVQGGFHLKQDVDPGKFGPPRHPYAFGELPMLNSVNPIARFSHLFAVGEGTALPASFAGQLFNIDPIHSSVLVSERQSAGSSFRTKDGGPVLTSEDEAFRPVFIVNAPDGALHIADFYEYYIAHGQHYQSQIDPTTGRIYRLRGRTSPLEKDLNLAAKSARELVTLLAHPNKWHRHTAARLLGERKESAVLPPLRNLLQTGNSAGALGALWALHQMNALDGSTLAAALTNASAPVRLWAVRLCGDKWGTSTGPAAGLEKPPGGQVPEAIAAALARLSAVEPNAEARSQIAASARRLPPSLGLQMVRNLLLTCDDREDPYIPQLCWWAIEHHLGKDPRLIGHFFDRPELWQRPVVSGYLLSRLMRRFAVTGLRDDLRVCARLLKAAPDAASQQKLVEGFEEAFRGKQALNLPEELQAALIQLPGSSLILQLRQGSAEAEDKARKIILDPAAKLEERLLYLAAFAELRLSNNVPHLLQLVAHDPKLEVRQAALSGLAVFPDPTIFENLLAHFPRLPRELHLGCLNLMISRPEWALKLLAAVEEKQLSAASLPLELVDRLRSHQDRRVQALAAKLLTTPDGAASPQAAEIEAALRAGPGDPYMGEKLFMERCAACHKLFFKGGHIGPDLTSYQRDHLGTMLASILQPSAEIREGYRGQDIEMADGRSLTGFVIDQDAQTVTFRGLDDQTVILRKVEIIRATPLARSLMPEGLLEGMDDQQLRDFFAFLRSSQPFTR